MSLKPLQTAKYVGIKWSPDREFTANLIEPLISPEYRRILSKEGKIALRSIGVSDYDGMHIENALHFDAKIHDTWKRRHIVQVAIDGIARKRQENNAGYRFKFHLTQPHAEMQRRLIHRVSIDDPIPTPVSAQQRDNMLESVFLDLPKGMLAIPDGDETYLDNHMEKMKQQIANQAIQSVGWLTMPEAYVTTYQLTERDLETLERREYELKRRGE